MTNYFVTRHKKHFLPLDPDAVESKYGIDNFVVEGSMHPHILLRSAKTYDTRVVRELTEELEEDMQGIASVAVLVAGVGGDFEVYSGSWNGEDWNWPKMKDIDAAKTRCVSLMQLDDVDLLDVAEIATNLTMLKPGEEKNSNGVSSSLPKIEESTSVSLA